MLRNTILALCIVMAAGCATSAPVAVSSPEIIVCEHIKDSKLNFSYNRNDVVVWKSLEYQVEVFSITTLDGKTVTFNTYEILNYKCRN